MTDSPRDPDRSSYEAEMRAIGVTLAEWSLEISRTWDVQVWSVDAAEQFLRAKLAEDYDRTMAVLGYCMIVALAVESAREE